MKNKNFEMNSDSLIIEEALKAFDSVINKSAFKKLEKLDRHSLWCELQKYACRLSDDEIEKIKIDSENVKKYIKTINFIAENFFDTISSEKEEVKKTRKFKYI